MLRMLEAQAPKQQTATDTISTLSSRLNNATLLEDRRAAILGLRSFAKEYPASVASGSLRGLIACLTKDLEDVDTIKVVLETLLMLFNPNADSPEASEEIALWLADEFTQRQDNVKTLLDLLETSDFFSRLYALKLLAACFGARPERTQECVLNSALGTSRLVATLEDSREAVRNEALELLGNLTQSSTELQKLVAFAGTYDHLFQLLEQEGGLQDGGIIVQDCLILLANLVRQNSSNQSLFRESGCVSKLSNVIKSAYTKPANGENATEEFPNPQRDRNVWGLLAVIRLFLVSGSVGTNINQRSFQQSGILQQVLDLAFRDATDAPIRSEALYTCADMIRGNPDLQAGFAQFVVPVIGDSEHVPQQNGATNGVLKAHVIDALLNLVIAANDTPFNIRLAACECIKGYITNHTEIRLHFLSHAINGHVSGEDETANILSELLGEKSGASGDPSRTWFAAVIALHLIWDDAQAKKALMDVSEGDASRGEEVVTCIQTLSGHLIAGIQRDDDERTLIAYLMLLCGLLYETPAAVDDFLGEGSSLQALIQAVSQPSSSAVLVKGLCALLIGILYEYSTKDSPVPRRKLQSLLVSSMGRERYLQALNSFRSHPFVRDYEVFIQGSAAPGPSSELPPYAYFDSMFVEFLKDNFSRFSRAIDRDPGIEIQVGSKENGVDRELVDSLRSQIEEGNQSLEKVESQILDLEQKLDQAQATHRRDVETSQSEIQRLTQINSSIQRESEEALTQKDADHSAALNELQLTSSRQIQDLQSQLNAARKAAAEESERTKQYYDRQLSQARSGKTNIEARLTNVQKSLDDMTKTHGESQKTIADLQSENKSWKRAIDSLKAASEKKDKQLQDLRDDMKKQVSELQAAVKAHKETAEDERTKVSMLEKEVSELEAASKKSKEDLAKSKKDYSSKEEERKAAQTELDDLFLMLQDIEEKRSKRHRND
ncbi:hypothetical protein BT63DRAFT_444927 [Microthyrium microscopicum]|uniref:Intracellular protein transport protein n=1 Tax=Microthyrium microscopicum TaxID=703497 RepID=A0A6A6USF9_9PEZI|nr:hypothetical protein BT63DRAFT_444927 [Microthyrium microscopicum]